MQRKFLQEKSLNRKQDNAEKSLNVDLSAKSKLIPYSTAADMLGLYDLYTEERDACESYRMIFTVNPICTNVLYNAVTEPVYREGSLSAVNLVETSILRTSEEFDEIFPNKVVPNELDGTINQSGDSIDQTFAVRDTEISHEKIGDFKYHCGYDIFNNHLLRINDFEHVKIENDNFNEDVFNTLFDYAIDYEGKPVKRILTETTDPITLSTTREYVRMYQLDTIKSMNTAFYDELRTVDGWFGFYNAGNINIPNAKIMDIETGDEKEISLNRILNNETPCGFIDLYPDRSLYSFIPKVNRYKKRLERNWDCTIAYPYKSDYDMFNRVMINFSGTTEEWDSWKVANQNKIPNAVRILNPRVTYNNVGDEIIEMHSILRHTIQPGDDVRIFFTVSDYSTGDYKEILRYSAPIKVVSVGDVNGNNTDRVFNVKLYDLMSICGVIEEDEEEAQDEFIVNKEKVLGLREQDGTVGKQVIHFFYRKIEDGCDDKYYFRKFKTFNYFEYTQIPDCDRIDEDPTIEVKCTDSEREEFERAKAEAVKVIKDPTVITEESPEYIRLGNDYFKKITRQLTYTQNKIAFAENIFGDRVAQVIFNDDICTTGLKDNLGRPLSVLYFTVVKTNRGHKEWYNSGITTDDAIEYSHCFGDVTSGLDLPEDSGATNFNVRKLYNVFSGECEETNAEYLDGLMLALDEAPVGDFIDGTPIPIESGITLENFTEFYGDIIEFSRVNFKETEIEKVYHRFNTAQRECLLNDKYFDVRYDELVGDLFDVQEVDE